MRMKIGGLTGLVAMGLWLPALVAAQPDERLKELATAYWDARMERYPTQATALGDYRFNDRLQDASEKAQEEWRHVLGGILQQVQQLPMEALSPHERLTRDLLERAVSDERLILDCHRHLTPLDPLAGLHIQFPLILVSQPFRHNVDYNDYIMRLRLFRRHVRQHVTNMRAGIARGWVSPRHAILKVIPQLQAHIVSDPRQSEFYKPMLKADHLSKRVRGEMEKRVVDAIQSSVIPAYRELLHFVENEYLPRCTKTAGIGSLPGGEEVYKKLVYLHTTVKMTPDEVHRIGLAEVKRIRVEMAKVQGEVGIQGSLDDFLQQMRSDPKHRFSSGRELRDAADAILKQTKPLLSKLFGRLPKANCVMKEVEAFRAASAPMAYYNPAPEDGSRPGYYYINTYAPQERLRFTLEALTYHEAVPGHHFQFALDRENLNLPKFRRYGSLTAYIEGWALYAEKLGYDIGGYQDPFARFGQLTFEMWRACRLVVDTGIHARGWSRKQAIEFMAANASLAMHDIETEIDRYFCWPGQALAYKIGELQISQLRRQAQEQLGDRFDLRAFHDALLSEGAMPIDILEKRMRDWITSRGE